MKRPFRPDQLMFPEGTTSEEMQQSIRGMANEAEGLCTNGCAPLIWDDPQNYHCGVCKFVGQRFTFRA